MNKGTTIMTTTELILAVITFGGGYALWLMKRYINKVDTLEGRVTKVETIIDLLGNIKEEIGNIKTDVAVIKSKVE